MARLPKAAAAAASAAAEKTDSVLEKKKSAVGASPSKPEIGESAGKSQLPDIDPELESESPPVPSKPVGGTAQVALTGMNAGAPSEGAAAAAAPEAGPSRTSNGGLYTADVDKVSGALTANGAPKENVMLSPVKKMIVNVGRTFTEMKEGRDFNGVVRIANMHTITGKTGGDTIRATLEDELGDKVPLRIFTGAMVKNSKGDTLIDQVNKITEQLNMSCNTDEMYLIMQASKNARHLVKGTATEKMAWPLTRDRNLAKEIQINSGNAGLIIFESVHEEDSRLSGLPHKIMNMDRTSFVMMRYDIVSDFKAAAVDYMNVNKQCDSNRFSEYNVHCVIKEEEDGYVCMDKLGFKVSARFGVNAKVDTLGVLFDNYSNDGVADIIVSFAEFKFERPSGTPTELWFGYFSDVMGLAEYEEKKKTLPAGFATKSIKIPDVNARLHASVPFGNASNRLALFAGTGGSAPTGSVPLLAAAGQMSAPMGSPVKVGNRSSGTGANGSSSSPMAVSAMHMPMQSCMSLKENPFAVTRERTGSEASFPTGLVEREATIAKRKKRGNDRAKTSKKQKSEDVEEEAEEDDDEGEDEN